MIQIQNILCEGKTEYLERFWRSVKGGLGVGEERNGWDETEETAGETDTDADRERNNKAGGVLCRDPGRDIGTYLLHRHHIALDHAIANEHVVVRLRHNHRNLNTLVSTHVRDTCRIAYIVVTADHNCISSMISALEGVVQACPKRETHGDREVGDTDEKTVRCGMEG